MKIFFRTDASLVIGQGHVMRCLTLAVALREHGVDSGFVCRDHPGNLCDLVRASGFRVHSLPPASTPVLPSSADPYAAWLGTTWMEDAGQTLAAMGADPSVPHWVVVDHYALDARWEDAVRARVPRVMAIDDIADRPHRADVLLDQNLYPDMKGRYAGLVDSGCVQLLGPRYALLRKEFVMSRQGLRPRDGSVARVLVFFGGSDVSNETGKTLDAIELLNRSGVRFDIVVGAANPFRDMLAARCDGLPNVSLHCNISNMAQLMADADLALGAAGTATWERCATGLPAFMLSVADNQVEIAKGVDSVGAQRYLGPCSTVTAGQIAAALVQAIDNPQTLREMSQTALTLVDTLGAERVVAALKESA
ncbi:MAG: UDP-2,4-diacetamido-2,4,6-trideoxy-beta-L-altropyranose hydrolase [Pseudomonadota bacterium]